ncbi:unannotated protein [freshwater metagenome]|uniref:Unannotated protein n=1 Tax=freshwater metagenome TaxID=449393 RepID=A0A6J6GTF9_9ZZZZ
MTGFAGLERPAWRVDVDDTIGEVAWSPLDDRVGVGCTGGDVVVLDAAGSMLDRRRDHPAGTACLAWHDGEVVSGGVDGWVVAGAHRERLSGWIASLASGPDGLAVAHGRHVSLLGGATSERLPASVAQVRWSSCTDAAGGRPGLVVCGHGYVSEFDADLSVRIDAALVWGGSVEQVDWSSGGGWAAASTRGTTNYLWPSSIGQGGRVVDPAVRVHVLPCPSSSGRLLRFDPTGRYAGIATSGGLAVFDLDEVHPVAGPPGRLLPLFCDVHAFRWWPAAPVAVLGVATDSGGGGLLLVRCDERAAPVGVVDLGTPVIGLEWSRDGRLLAAACGDGTVVGLRRVVDWAWQDSADQWDVTDRL